VRDGKVWEWGRAVGGNSWRTAGDLGGTFEGIGTAVSRDGFDVYADDDLHRFGGPGAWNDPDYLLSLLTNDAVIDVDQDPLGKPGRRVGKQGPLDVWARDLWRQEDVGVFEGRYAAAVARHGVVLVKVRTAP
jgi:alpha-galactosidase